MTRQRKARPQNAWSAGLGSGQRTVATFASRRQSDSTTPRPFRNCVGHVVGILVNGWLEKKVNCTRHQLRSPRAWCIDAEHLRRLRALGASGVLLTDEAGQTWQATVRAFDEYGIALDRGHGEQVALPLAKWLVRTGAEDVQLELFAGGGL